MDVPSVIHDAPGFVRTLGPTVVQVSGSEALLRLDAGPELHNHLGGPHAGAIFGLGETAAFAVLLSVFGDLVESGAAVPLIKSADIAYSALATGPLLAHARLTDDQAAARASLAERGVAVFAVEVVFRREADDVQTAVMRPQMALKRL